MKPRVMYVELESGYNDDGPAFIGWVKSNRTGRALFYRDLVLRRIHGGGIFSNHRDEETGDEYWVSGVKKNGEDRHWAGKGPVLVDDDALAEYNQIRVFHSRAPPRRCSAVKGERS